MLNWEKLNALTNFKEVPRASSLLAAVSEMSIGACETHIAQRSVSLNN